MAVSTRNEAQNRKLRARTRKVCANQAGDIALAAVSALDVMNPGASCDAAIAGAASSHEAWSAITDSAGIVHAVSIDLGGSGSRASHETSRDAT